MVDFLNSAVLPLAQLLEQFQFLHVDLEAVAIAEVNAVRMEDGLAIEVELARRITINM